MSGGLAFKMRLELAQLMRRHGVRAEPRTIPMQFPCDRPQVLSGFASTTDIDLQRMKFCPYAFGLRPPAPSRVPLHLKHDTSIIAGEITELAYDPAGNLRIRATAHHETARRCNAFSVAATVHGYEMKKSDTPDFYALITGASLDEISLTDVPANPFARVTQRDPVSALVERYGLLQQKLARLQNIAALLPALAQR